MIDFGIPAGSEQGGRRPAVVVGSDLHCSFPISMAIVVPCTTVDRGLPHHVTLDWKAAGLDRPTWARTEDIRSIAEQRLTRRAPIGQVSPGDLAEISRFVRRMVI
jgi:mRNA interferase MazF